MRFLSLALCLASIPLVAFAAPPTPVVPTITPAPPVMTAPPIDQDIGLKAAALWSKGVPEDVAAAYQKLGFTFPLSGAWSDSDRRLLSDWIVALTWSDPKAAAAKLAAWELADPSPELSDGWAKRTTLMTRILLEQQQPDQARTVVETAQNKLRAAIAASEAQLKSLPKSQRNGSIIQQLYGWRETGKLLRRAQFLADAQSKGDAAFRDYADPATNPFVDGSGSLFVNDVQPVVCANNDLKPDDWAILEVALVRSLGQKVTVYVRPFAASRFAAAKPFLEQSDDWNVTVRKALGDTSRKALMVRCTRNPRLPGVSLPDVDYLFDMLKPDSPKLPDGYTFDMFRQPPSDLVRDKQYVWLMNLSYKSEPNVPDLQMRAQEALLGVLKAMEKPDPVAIAIVEHLMLRDAEAGKVRQVKYWLPGRIAFLDKLRAQNILPPRILSQFELQLAQRHEANAEPEAASKMYRAIVVRDHGTKDQLAPEQIKAQLRLAAIAESAGHKAESEKIFAMIGLSPDQCSIYQQRPPLVDFKHPDYSGAMIREEAEGRLQFEFDLDKAGLPSNLRVTLASPPFLFDEKTLESFRRAKFAPITNGGTALACKGAEQSFVWRVPDY
jgi:Gram-negative bacterial TonB protein C-terminal